MTKSPWIQRSICSIPLLAVAAFGLTAVPEPVAAQESFYKGKTLNVVVRSGAGGGNDFYARLLARHIDRHVPGTPNVIVTNMPGGGGLVAANYIANRARKDGTEIGLLGRDLVIVQRLGATGVRFDARELIALGNMGNDTYIWVTRADHPVKSFKEIRDFKGTMRFGGTGAGTASVQSIQLFKADGFPVDVVFGFDGTAERILAVVRGDVDGTSGSYGSLLAGIKQENLRVLGRFGSHPELRDVPNARELITPERRPLATLMSAPLEMSRPLYTAPGVPKDRVEILREAIKATLHDPQLQAEAKRADRDVEWTSAEDIEKLTEEILNASDQVVADFRAL